MICWYVEWKTIGPGACYHVTVRSYWQRTSYSENRQVVVRKQTVFSHQNCLFLKRKLLIILQLIRCFRADSRLALSQWETLLQSNPVSHWLGANLESALCLYVNRSLLLILIGAFVSWDFVCVDSSRISCYWIACRKSMWLSPSNPCLCECGPRPGEHFTNHFSIIVQIWWKFHVIHPNSVGVIAPKVLHITWQLCCCGICEILEKSDELGWNCSKTNFL